MTPPKHTNRVIREDPQVNPNALHAFHSAKRGPKNIPQHIIMSNPDHTPENLPKYPGHTHAATSHISFQYFDQRKSNAPFGYEHYVSLPPAYSTDTTQTWPLILFLHGAGESQRGINESYASIRHGIPKVILCYDKFKSGANPPKIDIPLAPRLRSSRQTRQGDKSTDPVDGDVCTLLAENFITVTPSLNMEYGYGWNASILSALLDEIVSRYRVDVERVHVTGFSMGGYGSWDLAMYSPNRFATVMPICGGGDTVRAGLIKHVPHWVHHGDKDDIIPLRASQQMVRALEKAGAPEVEFTRYPELMHDSWTAAYGNIEVYKWILRHKRDVRGDEKVVPEENKVVVGSEST